MTDNGAVVAEFCSITGASAHVAEHFLESTGWSLNQAIEFYLENPPDASGTVQVEEVDELPASLDPGQDHAMGIDNEALFLAFGGPGHLTEDEQLRRALAQSMGNDQDYADDEVIGDEADVEQQQLAALAQLRERSIAAASAREDMDEERAEQGGFVDEGPSSFGGFGVRGAEPSMAGRGGAGSSHLDVPFGIDPSELEEARMLEAALLGVPYEGRIPDFAGMAASAFMNPALSEGRSLRWEQDQAFEESLAADQAREASVVQARRDAEVAEDRTRCEEAEAKAKQQQEEQEAAEKEAAKKLALETAIGRKTKSLPAEPDAAAPDVITIMVKLPDGSRQSRRFKRTDPLQAVFDYIDVQMKGDPFKPGSYSLVNSYPRKAFSDGAKGSLADAGLSTDTALFLEPLK